MYTYIDSLLGMNIQGTVEAVGNWQGYEIGWNWMAFRLWSGWFECSI